VPRVLIIKPSSLGDIIHGLQVAESLRAQVEGARIDWVARDLFAPLVAACETVERVHVFRRAGGVRGFAQLARALRGERYETVLDMQGLARSALLARAARAGVKLGRRDAREGAGLLLRGQPELPPGGASAHAVDILLQFLPAMGLRAELRGPLRFRPGPAPLPPELCGRAPVLLFPQSRRPEKEWPRFIEFTEAYLKGGPERPLVWLGPDALPTPPHWGEAPLSNLTGGTRVEDLPGLVEAASLVIANDSGPMHLAAALGRPVIALFGPTPPERFGPYPPGSPRHTVLPAPGGDLNRLEPGAVLEAVHGALAPH